MTIEQIKSSKYLVIASNHIVRSRLIVVVDSIELKENQENYAKELYTLKCHTAKHKYNFDLALLRDGDVAVVIEGIKYLFRIKEMSNNMLSFLEKGDVITFSLDNDNINVRITEYQSKYGRFLCKTEYDESQYNISTIIHKYGLDTIKGFTTADEKYLSINKENCNENK